MPKVQLGPPTAVPRRRPRKQKAMVSGSTQEKLPTRARGRSPGKALSLGGLLGRQIDGGHGQRHFVHGGSLTDMGRSSDPPVIDGTAWLLSRSAAAAPAAAPDNGGCPGIVAEDHLWRSLARTTPIWLALG